MTRLTFLTALVLTCSTTGCATIINGETQTIRVTTEPEGASFVVYPTNELGTTPGSLELRRNRTYTVRLTRSEHLEEFVHLSPRISNWLNANLLIGGLIGILIDIDSGGGWKLVPGEVDIVLRPDPTSSGPPAASEGDGSGSTSADVRVSEEDQSLVEPVERE